MVQTQAQDASGSLKAAKNPVIFADVPDMSVIRNGDTYYMSSTTMHMSPGVPLMKSKDMVNWELVSYAYDKLDDADDAEPGKWKECLRWRVMGQQPAFPQGRLLCQHVFAGTTGKTYIYTTTRYRKRSHGRRSVSNLPSMTIHCILMIIGKIYMLYGAG